jgi:ubiquinone biosynthesis protein UbiJ
MKIDLRITLALIVAMVLQTAGALIWMGHAAERLTNAERAVAAQPEASERLARVEEQLGEVRRSLARIEQRLEER